MFLAPPSLRRAAPLVAVLVAVLVVVLALLAVVLVINGTGSDPDDAGAGRAPVVGTATPTTAPATPLADYDTTGLTVLRAGFCDLVAPESIAAALGGEPLESSRYGNGESATLAPGLTDIAHEYGCRWQRGRSVVRAWVFAPPVTTDGAERLVADARKTEGCDVRRAAPDYGTPSIARTCAVGRSVEASYRGLFGDAWLACSRTVPGSRDDALDPAGEWCVAVATAASQPPA